jgi:hypothetical protein
MKRAGHDATALEEVRPLLREAADHYELEKRWKTGNITPAAAPPAPPPLTPAPVK